jgi:beta-lactamase regulating signal transducer with metallopeptidase domain
MNGLNAWLDTPLAYHLGWTLIHFLWQGAVVGALYALLRQALSRSSPQLRYGVGLLALVALVTLPCLTFAHLSAQPATLATLAGGTSSVAQRMPFVRGPGLIRTLVPWTVPLWCAGVLVMAIKALAGWRRVRALARHAVIPAPPVWRHTLRRLALAVGVRLRVELTLSAQVSVPCVIGWLKPVILLPPAALTGLTPVQLEMVLAHELAHIRRHDYLVNLLQTAVETLLFYHPVVRWISQDVRKERELCCDDAAVQACGDPLHYAHALADLAALRSSSLALAQSADGGELTLRVERLIGHHEVPFGTPRLAPLLLASALCFGGLWAAASMPHGLAPVLRLRVAAAAAAPSETTPAWRSMYAARPVAAAPIKRRHVRLEERIGAPQATSLEPLNMLTADALPSIPEPVETSTISADAAQKPAVKKDYDPNFYSTAPLQVISMHQVENDPPSVASKPRHQDRCEPVTGYRLCQP